jgi:hypothetical protein
MLVTSPTTDTNAEWVNDRTYGQQFKTRFKGDGCWATNSGFPMALQKSQL